MYGSSASEPTTPLRQTGGEKAPVSGYFSQVRSVRRESIRLPPFQLPEITAKLSQDAQLRPRSQLTPSQTPKRTPNRVSAVNSERLSMTPTRRRRRSSMIVTDTGETVYHHNYSGPITIDYLRFICKAIAHDKEREAQHLQQLQEKQRHEKQQLELQIAAQEAIPHEILQTEHSRPRTTSAEPTASEDALQSNLEIIQKNNIVSERLQDKQLPQFHIDPDAGERFITPDHSLEKEDSGHGTKTPHENQPSLSSTTPGTFDHSLQIPVETMNHFLSPTEDIDGTREKENSPAKIPKALSYLERILQSRLLMDKLKVDSDEVYSKSEVEASNDTKLRESSNFVIENKTNLTTYDINWGGSLSNIELLKPEEIPTDTLPAAKDNVDLDNAYDHNDNVKSPFTIEGAVDSTDIHSRVLDNDSFDEYDPPDESHREQENATVEKQDERDSADMETSPTDRIESDLSDNVQLPTQDPEVLSPIDISNFAFHDDPVRTPTNGTEDLYFELLIDQAQLGKGSLPNVSHQYLETGNSNIATPISDPLSFLSPSGIIQEQYTMDNDQLQIFSDNSDSEEEKQFQLSNKRLLDSLEHEDSTSLPRIQVAKESWKTSTGNVSLSLPTVKNLVNYINISSTKSGPPRKKRKDFKIAPDIYKLLWEKSDEFLGSLVSDLGAYARHRSDEEDPQINIQDVILYLNKLKFTGDGEQRESQVNSIAKLAQNFLPLELLLSLDSNLQSIRPPSKRDADEDYEDST